MTNPSSWLNTLFFKEEPYFEFLFQTYMTPEWKMPTAKQKTPFYST